MIKVNAIQCLNCKDIVYSRARHDMRGCTCGDCAIDGGFDYKKLSVRGLWPKNIEIEIDASKEDLYKDWNTKTDKFGLIKDNSKKELKKFVFE